jgi:N-acetylneuraminic acid mutarotase
LAALDGKLYAVGGFTGVVHMGPKPAAFVYDPETDKWRQLPDISSARGSVAVAAVGGKLHILGGRQADKVVKRPSPPGAPQLFAAFGTVNMHQIYDPVTGKWSAGAPVPGPARDHAGIAVLDGRIHLFGGRTADVVDDLARHDVYDPRTDTWSTAAPLPVARSAGAYTVLDGRIIYAGGECKAGGQPQTPYAFDDVTAYDSRADIWEMLAPLPQARHAFGAATVNGVAYFAGGSPVCGAGAMTDMLTLTLRKF